MLGRHGIERALALGRELHGVGAAVADDRLAPDEPFGDELVGDARDVAAGDHEAARQLAHLEPLRIALELRHQVEARQRRREALAQPRAHLAFDRQRAGEKPQPEAQRLVMIVVDARLGIGCGGNAPEGSQRALLVLCDLNILDLK